VRVAGCYMGSVNRWECDENDHLNVRFYAYKMHQALTAYLDRCYRLSPADVSERLRSHHMRFLREARMATPLRIDCETLSVGEVHEVLCAMADGLTGERLCTFVTSVDVRGLEPADVVLGTAELPAEAGPRGLDPSLPPLLPAHPGEAEVAGFFRVGAGVIQPEEADEAGLLLPHQVIGRMSDSMPNLWAFTAEDHSSSGRGAGLLGGAVLEYRLLLHRPLHAGARFAHLAGIRGLGAKTQHIAHLLFDDAGGALCASADAVAIAMDLESRRAVAIPPERRAWLEGLLIRESSRSDQHG